MTAAAPAWLPYATLAGIGTLAAGRRVRLFAGRESDAFGAPVTGEVRRYSGFAPGDAAGVRLPAKGVDLRLVAPDGRVVHARRFAPDGAFAPVPLQVLRAADGTGLVLVSPDAAAPGGSRLESGVYRLGWTFRRDNRAADPGSLVLRENGDSTAEVVRMDVRI